jgi:hypothetical protein
LFHNTEKKATYKRQLLTAVTFYGRKMFFNIGSRPNIKPYHPSVFQFFQPLTLPHNPPQAWVF